MWIVKPKISCSSIRNLEGYKKGMIGILGGMGTQAGLDFCNKIAVLNREKQDQQYPKFILFNKSDTPKRPENLKKYYNVLNELVKG